MPPSKRVSLLRKIISPNASENGAALSQYRKSWSSIGEERMKDRGLGACPKKKCLRSRPLELRKTPFWKKRLKLLS